MRGFFARLRKDKRGVSAIEFAMIAPVLILMIIGVFQMGSLFHSRAVLSNAVSEGARFATIFPRPTSAQIVTRVVEHRPASAGVAAFSTPTAVFTRNTATGTWFVDVSMTYTKTLNFIFFSYPVTLDYSRRANVYPPPT